MQIVLNDAGPPATVVLTDHLDISGADVVARPFARLSPANRKAVFAVVA